MRWVTAFEVVAVISGLLAVHGANAKDSLAAPGAAQPSGATPIPAISQRADELHKQVSALYRTSELTHI
jgi:hypothetical protein